MLVFLILLKTGVAGVEPTVPVLETGRLAINGHPHLAERSMLKAKCVFLPASSIPHLAYLVSLCMV